MPWGNLLNYFWGKKPKHVKVLIDISLSKRKRSRELMVRCWYAVAPCNGLAVAVWDSVSWKCALKFQIKMGNTALIFLHRLLVSWLPEAFTGNFI